MLVVKRVIAVPPPDFEQVLQSLHIRIITLGYRVMIYEWVIVGGGVAGIIVAEILTREGHQVFLIDRDPQLASATTKLFHEWIHTGALYTLIPDKLVTLKFLLGAIDDLFEYYSCFERMNLEPTECGIRIKGEGNWFSSNYITFKFRRRVLNLPWSLCVARSEYLIGQIKKHDWLRRRAGVLDEFRIRKRRSILKNLQNYVDSNGKFYPVECTDFTGHSRNILRDLVATAMGNGLEFSLADPVQKIDTGNGYHDVVCRKGTYRGRNVVVCTGKNIADFMDVTVKTSYAPIAVVKDLDDDAFSFVELDYYPKKCINLITKPGGIGMIGGISFADKDRAEDYLQYVIEQHKKINRNIDVIGTYLGEKNEIIFKNESRNYLFHIVPNGSNLWAIVPGKFTLAFSLAVEFYRRVFKKNPRKYFQSVTDTGSATQYVSNTLWHDLATQNSRRP